MSGYGDSHRSSDRDRTRYGRDQRERSPRRDSRSYREPRYEQEARGGPRRDAEDRHGDKQKGQGSRLPATVPVPPGGRELNIKGFPMSGTAGIQVLLEVNFFEIQSLPVQKTFAYDMRLRVPESSQRRGSEKVTLMQQAKVLMHGAVKSFWGNDFVFDGVSTAWSPRELVPVGETVSTTIELEGHSPERPNQIEIHIRNNGLLDIKSLVQYVQSGNVELDYMANSTIEPLMRWLNAVFRKDAASRFVSRPRSNAFFERTPSTCLELQSTAGLLEAIRGVFQTVQIRFGRLGLNVDTSTTAFYVPHKNLIELAHGLTGVAPRDDLQRWFSTNQTRFIQSCQRLEGMSINVRHLSPSQNARKIKILRLGPSSAQDTSFNERRVTGEEVPTTVSAYYERKHSIRLRYPQLPLAATSVGFFPLELCYTSSGERYREQLQGAETADFIRFATAPAFVRSQQIMANVEKLHWHELETPKAYGLSVKPSMLKLSARILPSPNPVYSNGSDMRAPILGSWNLRNKQFLQPVSIKSYGLLYLPGNRAVGDAQLQEFIRSVQSGFSNVGMKIPANLPAYLKGNPQGDIKQIITELLAKTASAFHQKTDLLIILIHSSQERLYKVVKATCDVRLGVSSQVIQVEKAFGRGQAQYIANIALKVNAKRGGINSRISEPLFQKRRWMMIGGDVTHPSPAQRRLNPPPPSFTAISGSYDQNCCSYMSITSAQGANEELIADLTIMVKELLERFRLKQNGSLPESIIYWRDGVSETQFEQLLAVEVAALKEACRAVSAETPAPKVTVVCCVKRHHTRLFPLDRGDKHGNCFPGTIVENSSDGHDFYLLSQAVLQGTARPSRYLVLLDDNNLSVDDIQRLTNSLCWNYARATKAVGLVSPAYYAHQVADRARIHLSEGRDGTLYLPQVHDDLKYKMYWQ